MIHPHPACLRPVQLRRTDTVTGESVSMMVPCGATQASICRPCAERGKMLRAAQCREGWHLEDEPDLTPGAPDEMQEFWLILRAEAQVRRDTAAATGQDTTDSEPTRSPGSRTSGGGYGLGSGLILRVARFRCRMSRPTG